MDGTHLWRIDLGVNVREGEHYTQFMVYDLDGDGRAEMACKTADGTIDGRGNVIGDRSKDWRIKMEGDRKNGRILQGPEYFTIFDGMTGAALKTVDYIPGRDPSDGWGGKGGNGGNDSYGNRCDRFLACVAYLDGERPSVVMCRGVYGRIVITAWDWRDGNLSNRWTFDSKSSYPPYDDASPFSGMGGHSLLRLRMSMMTAKTKLCIKQWLSMTMVRGYSRLGDVMATPCTSVTSILTAKDSNSSSSQRTKTEP